jgi:hypothetical protein
MLEVACALRNLPVHKHENDDSGIAAKMLLRKRNSSAHPSQGSAISPGISPLVPTAQLWLIGMIV